MLFEETGGFEHHAAIFTHMGVMSVYTGTVAACAMRQKFGTDFGHGGRGEKGRTFPTDLGFSILMTVHCQRLESGSSQEATHLT
jgi:hypothetical protein